MKRIYTLLVLLLLFGISYGKHIDENTAKNIGQAFVSGKTDATGLKSASGFQLVYSAKSASVNPGSSEQPATLFYVFNVAQSGFVIVAGDDNFTPVLGYSDNGAFEPEHIPQNVAKWMEGYKNEIRTLLLNNVKATPEIIHQWEELKNGALKNSSGDNSAGSVAPLMKTTWDQSPYYNAMCPGGSVTGCVATATAQIMKYWNYPATGSGFHSYNHSSYGTLSANFGGTTYDWNSMPNSVNAANSAVASLMYQVGVSVDMDYSPESSGAYVISAQSPVTNCAEYALKTYFGYKSSLKGVQRSSYTQAQWLALLKAEFDASRPVLYAGFGSGGGHCFVADGYDNNSYIHFNWGWGGAYDGFFIITALNPGGVGTGGGTGGFNSGHQAVIGIEPPATQVQMYSLALYDYVTPSASSIYYGQAFTVTTNVENSGTATFSGDYTVAVFDNAYNFVDFVETKSGYSLQSGYVYSNKLVFSTTGLLSMLPGKYYAGIFYRPAGGNWVQVSDKGSYTNLSPITVTNPNDIELNSAISIFPGSTLIKGSAVSANLNIVNDGTATFTGKYAVDLYNLDGSWAQALGEISENAGLAPRYTYNSPYLTFSSTITVEPGTYLMAVMHNPTGGKWELTGSSYFQNPVKVKVVAAPIISDKYENNNSVEQAYNLPVSFIGNSSTQNTSGSNCHITTDNDFYKVVLPSGYKYTITPRIHDSYNSGNGETYSLDGLFSYSTDGSTWSEAFDDVMPGSITLNGGGTLYFHVAPYFAGETGTYLLGLTLTRVTNVGVPELETNNVIKVYPNPAKDFITIDMEGFTGKLFHVGLLNSLGKLALLLNTEDAGEKLILPLKNLPGGIYFLQIQTSIGIKSEKIIIEK
jgi:hypothetical protein